MQNQENRAPMGVTSNEAPFGSPRPLPVKNTFIHYGTPIRHGTGISGTPKTVPPNFAPEADLLGISLAPFPGATSSLQPAPFPMASPMACPMASPMPNTGGRPGPDHYRNVAERDGQANRSRAVAPLRLFDFLPSPTVQQAPQPHLVQMMQQAPAQMPVNTFMVAPPPPQTVAPQLWQQTEPAVHAQSVMAPAPTYAPMGYCTEGIQSLNSHLCTQNAQQSLEQQWSSWNGATATVQLPAATAHCLGPVNNPSIVQGSVPGMAMAGPNAVPMMAPGAPTMYMAAPAVQQPLTSAARA